MNRLRLLALLALALGGCDEDTDAAPDTTDDAMASDMAPMTLDMAHMPSDMAPDAIRDTMTDAIADAAPDAAIIIRPVAADNAVPPDHPLALGQHRFVYDNFGLEPAPEWPPADFLLALLRDEPEVFGEQFSAFGFVPNPDDELPFGLPRGALDPDRVYQTCAICHVGVLPDGRVWLGAPNTRLDFGGFRVAVNDRWVAAGGAPLTSELQLQKDLELGPGRFHAESEDYPQVVPADFPPYFALDTRRHFNHLGTGRDVKTEAYLALYSFGLGNPDDETAVAPFPAESRLAPLIEYLGQIAPPAPPAQDPALVARGAEVFAEARCDACHHPDTPEDDGVTPIDKADDGRDRLPGEDPEWPDGSIHTSPLHRVLIDGDGDGEGGIDEGRIRLIQFIARHRLRLGPTDGYRVPTLAGLWATAPYLHNGSVPTLDALLRPAAERPVTFEHADALRDTTRPGNGNRGHEFGVDLSEDDRAALVAWLLNR